MFQTRTEAFLHPLVQYGDALLESSGDLLLQYNRLEWCGLMRLAEMPVDAHHESISGMTPLEARIVMQSLAERTWECLQRAAREPPEDPAVVCEIVSRDRRKGSTVSTTAERPEPAPEKTEAPSPRGHLPDARIHMSMDKEGKRFGPDNNPKRAGSASAARFAEYRDGMTVQEAIDAGLKPEDISWDIRRGYISLSGGTPAAPKEKAPPAAPKGKAARAEAVAEPPVSPVAETPVAETPVAETPVAEATGPVAKEHAPHAHKGHGKQAAA